MKYKEIDCTIAQTTLNEAKIAWCEPSTSSLTIIFSEVMHCKYLGLYVPNNLSWTKHVDTVMAK